MILKLVTLKGYAVRLEGADEAAQLLGDEDVATQPETNIANYLEENGWRMIKIIDHPDTAQREFFFRKNSPKE